MSDNALPSGLPPRQSSGSRVPPSKRKKDYTPVDWSVYWGEKKVIGEGEDEFTYFTMGDQDEECYLLLLHGGGFSALSFSLFAKQIRDMANCFIIAPDLRGHGRSRCQNESNLSMEQLTEDVVEIFDQLCAGKTTIIVGHSMGGALAVHVSHRTSCVAVIVIDVVEGTALDALPAMEALLRGRPPKFKSKEFAVEWAVRTGYIKNVTSAKVSMPAQIVDMETVGAFHSDIISEENQPTDDQVTTVQKWRTNLVASSKYWKGWFQGLSSKFLTSPAVKMLLLAGMDRLDTELTVGQMQGKFQLTVLPQAGHAVHEDQPRKVAEHIAAFIIRHKFSKAQAGYQTSPMVPGMGGLGRMGRF